MPSTALILGGTYGLGLALAHEAVRQSITPIIGGRSIENPERMKHFPLACETVFFDATNCGTFVERLAAPLCNVNYLVYSSGEFLRMDLGQIPSEDIERVVATNLTAPMKIIRDFHARRRSSPTPRPYHLIVIGSSSAFRLRTNEEVYCATKAGLAHFTRNVSERIAKDIPGSRTLLVNPGGIETEFFKKTDQDTSVFMKPALVAKFIWSEVLQQGSALREINLLRGANGTCVQTSGPIIPEERSPTR